MGAEHEAEYLGYNSPSFMNILREIQNKAFVITHGGLESQMSVQLSFLVIKQPLLGITNKSLFKVLQHDKIMSFVFSRVDSRKISC